MSDSSQVYVGRQPILDTRERVVGYELLFRASASAQVAVIGDADEASSRVIANTFASFGADAILGPCRGWFNVTRDVLLADFLEVLPTDRITIEVLEDVPPDAEVVARCEQLSSLGFRLALDDWVVNDPRKVLLPFAEVVKVDVLALSDAEVRQIVGSLKGFSGQLLAERVETREQVEHCKRLGFELFQGFFFARAQVMEGRGIDPARGALLGLLALIQQDAETRELSEPFKRQTELGINLLRLVNSAAFARPGQIGSVENAVNYLGRRALRRWTSLLLYAVGDDAGFENPLLLMAARRGRMLEHLHGTLLGGAQDAKGDGAFLVGMLSLADTLLSRDLSEILDEMHLEATIVAALLRREGVLGDLLDFVEAHERGDFLAVEEIGSTLGLKPRDVTEADLEAAEWAHSFGESAA